MQIRGWVVPFALVLTLSGRAHAQDDDDDDDYVSAPAKPSQPTSMFHEKDDKSYDDPDCTTSHRHPRRRGRQEHRREELVTILEAAAHANEPMLVRRAYNALFLTDENGTPGEDFANATEAKKQFEAEHPEITRMLGDSPRARQYVLVHLDLAWDGKNRLMQAASSAGDPLLLESVQPLLTDSSLQADHGEWVTLHPAFVAEVNDPAKAKAYVTEHVTALSGNDEEHRAWYAAQHAGLPSIQARAKVALALEGDREPFFEKAQTSWEQAHAGELAALQGDAARAYVAEHLAVTAAPPSGSDDDHLLVAAASASGNAALTAQVRRQLELVDYNDTTEKGVVFDEAQRDWETTHADALKGIGDPTAYVRAHVKPLAYEFPEEQLKTYVAAEHATDGSTSAAHVMMAYKIADSCKISHFIGNAKLYAAEHPEFLATVDTPAKADAYFHGHVAVTAYSKPWDITGLVVGASVGLGIITSTGDSAMNAASSVLSGATPVQVDIEYRPSAGWGIGISAADLFESVDGTKCHTSTSNCDVDHAFELGGHVGFRLASQTKYQPWLTLGVTYVNSQVFAAFGSPPVIIKQDLNGLGFRARVQANLVGNTSYRLGPFAELSYASLGSQMGATGSVGNSLGLLTLGISGSYGL